MAYGRHIIKRCFFAITQQGFVDFRNILYIDAKSDNNHHQMPQLSNWKFKMVDDRHFANRHSAIFQW